MKNDNFKSIVFYLQDHVLGIEFSGRSHCGKRLMGLRSYGCLSSHIELGANNVFCNDVPKNWSLEDAVTVPLAYYTVIMKFELFGSKKNYFGYGICTSCMKGED